MIQSPAYFPDMAHFDFFLFPRGKTNNTLNAMNNPNTHEDNLTHPNLHITHYPKVHTKALKLSYRIFKLYRRKYRLLELSQLRNIAKNIINNYC